jgi:hypothetical protein
MDREQMIETIINDMEDWAKRDKQGFWDHIRDLERDYLKTMGDEELASVHENSI